MKLKPQNISAVHIHIFLFTISDVDHHKLCDGKLQKAPNERLEMIHDPYSKREFSTVKITNVLENGVKYRESRFWD